MNPTFNYEQDEEINEFDKMMQWSGYPVSSTSSGRLSADYVMVMQVMVMQVIAQEQDSTWVNPRPFAQVPEPPQQHASDLNYIDPEHNDDLKIPQIPQPPEDLGSSTTTLRPADYLRSGMTAHPWIGLDRTTVRLPNSPSLHLQPSPKAEVVAIDGIIATFRALVCNQPCSPDQFSQGLRDAELIKSFLHSKFPPPPISSIGSSERDRELFWCWQCDPHKERKIFAQFGVFKRHLIGHGIREFRWRCTEPRCSTELYRRDRIRDHLLHKHKKSDPLKADVDETRVKNDPPSNCPLCLQATSSWIDYFKHIRDHCLVSPGSANASTDGDRSRHGDNNGRNGGNGNGNGRDHSSSFAGPSNWSEESQSHRSNNQTQGTTHPITGSGGFRSRGNALHGPSSHSVSENQLNSSLHQSAADAIGQTSIDDSLGPSRTSKAQIPRASGQPGNLQPPQNPGMSQTDHPAKRKRKDKRKKPTEEEAPSRNICKRCDHDMAKCEDCKTIHGCHKCGDVPRSSIQVGSSSTMPMQAPPGTSSTVVDLNGFYLNPGVRPNFAMPETMTTQIPFHYNANGMMQFPRQQRFENMANTFTDDPFSNDHFFGVAMDVPTHPPLRVLGDKFQESSVHESDTRLLHSMGLGTLIDPIFVQGPTKEPTAKACGVPAPGSYTDLLLRDNGPSPSLEPPQPEYRCQLPRVTLPAVDYESQAKLQLSTKERVEITFKMSPAREPTLPLRTRVQVLVRLFSLRASAAKSKTKKQRTQPVASGTTSDDDAESAADSEQDLALTSLSGSETTPPLCLTEDVQDWSFSFDLKWAILKLAQGTSGMDAEMCLRQFLSDPGYGFDLISTYIVCMFEISWLLKGRKGLSFF
ncbi:Zinc finger, C2H2 [Penicillium italicum]|uniref:Zinc finger, C2H2 n=1 Tax=Penicillium italicum TaxID=40296 RepID=A0A0A2L5C4_PENIT|nr:Zinc finger, C2H2 [Penicillium italicum]